jgi:fused signal recognition particle receptor
MLDLFKRKSAANEGKSWAERLKDGLSRSREKLAGALTGVFARKTLDDETLEDLETALITADVGVPATEHLIADLTLRWKRSDGDADAKALLKGGTHRSPRPLAKPLVVTAARPFVIMLAGVNGAGKTTSIGKLAKYLQSQGLSVLLAAGDTFRAAAREQLAVWGERNGVAVIAQDGGDPAAVMFDAISAATARGIDVVLADTAGRLPTQLNLMEEIRKVQRVIRKIDPTAPHENAARPRCEHRTERVGTGEAFDDALDLTGLVRPLDGSAKEVAWSRRSRKSGRCRSSLSVWVKASTTCGRFRQWSSSMLWTADHAGLRTAPTVRVRLVTRGPRLRDRVMRDSRRAFGWPARLVRHTVPFALSVCSLCVKPFAYKEMSSTATIRSQDPSRGPQAQLGPSLHTRQNLSGTFAPLSTRSRRVLKLGHLGLVTDDLPPAPARKGDSDR